jgi:hypothetical protein
LEDKPGLRGTTRSTLKLAPFVLRARIKILTTAAFRGATTSAGPTYLLKHRSRKFRAGHPLRIFWRQQRSGTFRPFRSPRMTSRCRPT